MANENNIESNEANTPQQETVKKETMSTNNEQEDDTSTSKTGMIDAFWKDLWPALKADGWYQVGVSTAKNHVHFVPGSLTLSLLLITKL
jgi:hypothetical protein